MKKDMRLVQCIVNGKEVAEYVDVRESLLDMLRNRLGLTSVKKGCEAVSYTHLLGYLGMHTEVCWPSDHWLLWHVRGMHKLPDWNR